MSEEEVFKGTIKENADFNPETAAKQFKKAMKGIGSDENAIIRLLVSHNNLQRAEIKEKYKQMYGQDLVDDLKDELGGHFEDTVVSLLNSPYDLILSAIKQAFGGVGVDEKALIDVICCKTAEELSSISHHYEVANGRSLDEDLESELSGDFRSLMRSLVAAGREEDEPKDSVSARKDAQDLYDAGIGMNADTDSSEFIRILNMRSYPQLQEIFDQYESIAGHNISEAIEKEFSGDMKNGLLAIVQRVRDPAGFYAERVNQALDGPGTDDKSLIRILVSRSEIDLADIVAKYKELYDASMADAVKDDTSGDYRKLLLAIINGSP